ncbi:MAG: glucose-6-phosphate isomerase [Gammaproteobacteria bacterium]|nr:glucose-6-phosphate isomerase [Gammaproteobacteria bacterium]
MIDFLNITPDRSECPDLVDRLQRRDASLWSDDPEIRRDIENRLGWLDAANFMDRHAGRVVDFARQVQGEGYQQAVLLGMGGSSLAPEVYAALFGGRPGALPLTVLDTTCPGHIAAVTARCEAVPTLFIVSSKSGTTAETSALEAHFFDRMASREGAPGRRFIAVTDAGSPLAALATERGYRDTFLNPEDIGGRFSALSFFGLIPAALAGAEPAALRAPMPTELPGSDLATEACALGTALATAAREGRNKLTLCFSPGLAAVAPWVEQLIDESTGKDGTGIVVVAGEPRFEAGAYSNDRFFVVVELADESVDEAWLDRLAGLGHPVARWRMADSNHVGAEFFRWQVATAAAGRGLGINPFDEPDVNASKAETRAILEQPGGTGAAPPDPLSALREMLNGAAPSDYIAILAYVSPGDANREALATLRERLTRLTGLPCCPGFGPRYLHSSGQVHKGGPDQGLFIVITREAEPDLPIPGQRHGFGSLIRAQALGDLRVLRERGRRVVHLELSDGMSLEGLLDYVW